MYTNAAGLTTVMYANAAGLTTGTYAKTASCYDVTYQPRDRLDTPVSFLFQSSFSTPYKFINLIGSFIVFCQYLSFMCNNYLIELF